MYHIFKDPAPLPNGAPIPTEMAEQITLVNRIRTQYPDTYGRLVVHIANEGRRTVAQAQRAKAEGMTTGAADIIIPARRPLVMELKRRKGGRVSAEQEAYLTAAWELGAFACLCYGLDAAWVAFNQWREEQ